MSKKHWIAIGAGLVTAATAVAAKVAERRAEKTTYKAELMEPIETREMGFYEKHVKRGIDIACAAGAITVFSPLYLGVAALVRIKLGSPVLFTQDRPGLVGEDGKESIFKMYKFRTMTDERDENGKLLPDEVRLTKFGAWLRNTSLDELPEAFNILNGTMSVIGPRPQLVRDMVFMSKEQRARHTAKPGLSGLAQVNGRNSISWEDKLNWDQAYIKRISFVEDAKVTLKTVEKAFVKQEGITEDGQATALDYGDSLLQLKKIEVEKYDQLQSKARNIISKDKSTSAESVHSRCSKYSVLMSIYVNEDADQFECAIDSMINQTCPPDEIVLVEDGPLTKELYDVIDKIKGSHPNLITSVIHESNQGLGVSLQHGLVATRNELVARMDTDDIAVGNRCEQQLDFLNEHLDVTIIPFLTESSDGATNIYRFSKGTVQPLEHKDQDVLSNLVLENGMIYCSNYFG